MIRRPYQQSKFEGRTFSSSRIGATLVEVLMSLLIMSIGIVSVFSLFPVAILSSIKATQLTNGKLLEENVVELLRANPQLVECYPRWLPLTTYASHNGTVDAYDAPASPSPDWRVVPPPKSGQVFSPTTYFFQASSSSTTSGPMEPTWPSSGTVTDGTVVWTPVRSPAYRVYPPDSSLATAQQRVVYVVDPLGYWNSDDSSSTYALGTAVPRTRFGSDSAGTSAYSNSGVSSLPRNHANLTRVFAETYFSLPDSWSSVVEAVPTDVSNDTASMTPRPYVTFSAPVDLTGIATGSRITVMSNDRTKTATRYVDPANSTITQARLYAGDSFPPGVLDSASNVGLARIETYNRRYSYLLTVLRKPDGSAKIYCPVFFNRSFSTLDERVFDAALYGDTIYTQWASGTTAPFISEGNYAYDALNGHWYRIVSVTSTATSAQVVVDRSLEVQTSSSSSYTGGVMFHPGIIKVFDIEL